MDIKSSGQGKLTEAQKQQIIADMTAFSESNRMK